MPAQDVGVAHLQSPRERMKKPAITLGVLALLLLLFVDIRPASAAIVEADVSTRPEAGNRNPTFRIVDGFHPLFDSLHVLH